MKKTTTAFFTLFFFSITVSNAKVTNVSDDDSNKYRTPYQGVALYGVRLGVLGTR